MAELTNAVDEFSKTYRFNEMEAIGRKHAEELDVLRSEKMKAVTDLVTFKARMKEMQRAYAKMCSRLETERGDLLIKVRNLRADLATARNDALEEAANAVRNPELFQHYIDGPLVLCGRVIEAIRALKREGGGNG